MITFCRFLIPVEGENSLALHELFYENLKMLPPSVTAFFLGHVIDALDADDHNIKKSKSDFPQRGQSLLNF